MNIPDKLFAVYISNEAKFLYVVLVYLSNNKPLVSPGQKRLSEYMGRSDRMIRDYLAELESVGLIVPIKDEGIKRKRYYITQYSIFYKEEKMQNMKHRRKHQHRIWRKSVSPIKSIKEWSRMLHLWWKKDVLAKSQWKKEKVV